MPKLTTTVTRLDDNRLQVVQSLEQDPQIIHIDDIVRREAQIVAQRDKELADREEELVVARKMLADAKQAGVEPTAAVADLQVANAKAPAKVEIAEVVVEVEPIKP